MSALAPGRWMMWNLGVGHQVLHRDVVQAYEVTVDAVGPYGPIDQLRYTIDLSQWTLTAAQPPGSLHEVRNAVVDIAKAIKDGR